MFDILIIYSSLVGVIVIFQLFVLFGAQVGHFDYGGFCEGKLPTGTRVFAGFYVLFLILSELVMMIKLNLLDLYIYFDLQVLIASFICMYALVMILHMIVKNSWNRHIWAPVNMILMTASIMIYFTK
ncbi:hypothetical protein EZV73_03965 [Acidaminobacter sp. JC074]|uniref:hypothetical protein n=1 Tax=Acidaminobacter sp. JC074 TaxID=2530199 RepID=UPI001F0EA793|nr:hypothetical protein [Acidaminobacter sp. JC074]MCH4886707.1 hypothetical protein [Acidaminobacter sp. JC074]